MTEQRQRFIKPGEALAIDPSHLHAGPSAFFWLLGGGATESERRGAVSVVHVRDALEHHAGGWGDSYEAILDRVRKAMSGEDEVERHKRKQQAHKWAHEYEDGFQPLPDAEATKPAAVVLCLDSPGGVVSGLNETVYALRRLRKETGVPLVAYVNELAASAAYALACGCEAIYCPETAIVGSVGVISTMISQARKNEKDGFDVALLTSGACKADGHLHAPLTDAAKAREQMRVDKLAAGFFRLAAKARGISPGKIESFQAAIYLGPDAALRGLVDEVCSFETAIAALQPDPLGGPLADGNETDRRATRDAPRQRSAKVLDATRQGASPSQRTHGAAMLKIQALIKKTQAAIAAEKDPEKLSALYADLGAYKKTEKHIEHHTTEEGEPDEADPNKPKPDDGDDEGDKDEKKAAASDEDEKKAAKGAEDEEEACNEEDEAKAAVALVRRATGRKGAAAVGAATAMFAQLEAMRADVAKLKADATAAERKALVARAEKYAPKRLVAPIASGPLATLRAFVEEAEKGAPMLATSEGDLLRPKAAQPGTEEALPEETIEQIDAAVEACGLADPKAFRASLVAAHLKAHNERIGAAMNGAQGRI